MIGNLTMFVCVCVCVCSLPHEMSALADGIREVRSLIFFRTKESLWNKALFETKCQPSDRELELDRFKAAKLKEKGKTDYKVR